MFKHCTPRQKEKEKEKEKRNRGQTHGLKCFDHYLQTMYTSLWLWTVKTLVVIIMSISSTRIQTRYIRAARTQVLCLDQSCTSCNSKWKCTMQTLVKSYTFNHTRVRLLMKQLAMQDYISSIRSHENQYISIWESHFDFEFFIFFGICTKCRFCNVTIIATTNHDLCFFPEAIQWLC